jgi:hypothetical protein
MLFLHAGSLTRVQAHDHPNIGRLLQPREFSRLGDTLKAGYGVALDNDGFKGVDIQKYAQMLAGVRRTVFGELPTIAQLNRHAGYPSPRYPRLRIVGREITDGSEPEMMPKPPANLLWIVVPDAVGDARKTLGYFQWLHPLVADLPLAFVLQDGAGDVGVPFGAPGLRCLFVGGSDAYKESAEAAELVAEGKRQGLLIHGGRCNSARRAHYFASIGCDSFDGTGASMFPKHIPKYLSWAAALPQQRLVS